VNLLGFLGSRRHLLLLAALGSRNRFRFRSRRSDRSRAGATATAAAAATAVAAGIAAVMVEPAEEPLQA
jgi:hypothetical protein